MNLQFCLPNAAQTCQLCVFAASEELFHHLEEILMENAYEWSWKLSKSDFVEEKKNDEILK
jgi:hypothetical protein